MILNDILTGEQIDMLKSDLSDNDLFTLLFLNDEEKHNFFRNFRSTWLAKYDEYFFQFNALYEDYCEYKSSDSFEKSVFLVFCERLHSFFVDMQRCLEFIRIYDIILDFI